MMINISNATGAPLDWAVATDLPAVETPTDTARFLAIFRHQNKRGEGYAYSRAWSHGGPIIEQEQIVLINPTFKDYFCTEYPWLAWKNDVYGYGDTPLIAAMRCYVASVLGDEVEVPDELTQGESK
jgi:hypothetical protein